MESDAINYSEEEQQLLATRDAVESIKKRSAGTISTIFSIINTMVGSTILSLAWGFRQSGLYLGIIVFVLVGLISYYTCNLVVQHSLFKISYNEEDESVNNEHTALKSRKKKTTYLDLKDFSQVCVEYLGKWSEILCLLTSIVILIGASIAYHIFMKDCLMSIINGIADINYDSSIIYPWEQNGPPWYWNGILASVIIVFILFPISLLKNLTFLVKFNSFGIFFVLFLIIFIIYACVEAMVEPFNFATAGASLSTLAMSIVSQTQQAAPAPTKDVLNYSIEDDIIQKGDQVLVNHLTLFNSHFSHLLAILSLSFFIHNVIGPILKNQRSLTHTKRDTAIAFLIAALIYAVPGMLGAFAFRFSVDIEQNFLNQFSNKSIYANISRGAVLLQLMSIYPLLLSVIRVQFFSFVYRKNKAKQQYPGIFQVALLNLFVCLITTSMAAFYPMVGTVLRFTGAICGLIYMYLLPVSIHLVAQYKQKKLTFLSVIFHTLLVLLGLSILILQFINFE